MEPKKVLTINLKGTGYYTWFRYPMGELQVRLNEAGVKAISEAETINIIADIKSAEDIIHVALLYDAITGVYPYCIIPETTELNLIIPYLPYGRADRRFTKGDCFGLGLFISVIEALDQLNDVVTLDAHSSYITENTDWKDINAESLIRQALIDTALVKNTTKELVVLFPDAGARKRYTLPEFIGGNVSGFNVKVLNCEKKRNAETGKFEGFIVPAKEEFPVGVPVIIVDDICDGGGTFVGIAEALKDYNLTELSLYVTHGIFSKGFDQLAHYFKRIYTTNSIGRDSMDVAIVYDCFPLLLGSL